MGGGDGSEEESGWERSSTSRGINTAAGVVSGSSLGSTRKPTKLAAAEEVDQLPASCTDELDRRVGYSADHHRGRRRGSGGDEDEDGGEVSLREWLDRPERSVDLLECLHIFRQVVEMVSLAHSQGVAVGNVRPSCFIMSTFNRVSFIESASCSSSGSDSCGNGGGSEDKDDDDDGDGGSGDPWSTSPSRPAETSREGGYEQTSDTSCLRSCSAHGEGTGRRKEDDDRGKEGREVGERKKSFPLKRILLMEYNWYTSPEESAASSGSFASDIYKLGVLLFELFCPTGSFDEKLRTMSNLRHRVLPPPLLLKWPKEASFCLWLLHPQPNTRPKLSEVLQSEFLNEPRDSLEEREAAIKLREEIEDQELLLEFLLRLQQCKQETADKLHDMVFCLSSDIGEILKQLEIVKKKDGEFYSDLEHEDHSAVEKDDSVNSDERSEPLSDSMRSESQQKNQEVISSKSSRLMKNFKKLEAAYFSTRCRMTKPGSRHGSRNIATAGRGPAVNSVDNLLAYKEVQSETRQSEWISPFLEGLRKYLSFSKLRVRADLRQGDLLNSSNLVCSLGFDRDRELFATAGVNRKIKIFECDVVLNEDRDMHYPVVEMVSRSKLSSICWNGYIKSQIASSDFEGVVQVWDVTRSKVFLEMREHERRVWSVDFSLTDPTKLASGSDDGTVKLWNINQNGSTGTIKTKANVCSVQFPPDSAWSLAVGSADHRIYLYDLRNVRAPLYTLVGHAKTVSYVKVLDSPVQTFAGHTNVKNFVGLSISDGYIVFVYHKAFPMPVLSFKFNSFISCVCWRGQSSTLVAANSTGNIKLLEMI
ncbi:unnamed protein product [Spirodela intermedia]|uniref:Uncharacterized protein n=1 Tax=Spirodela intermedia TaxID=51605 RepID=A0A7I8JMW0_SPIIN|nr:unnamed protein product [Spirodela intermedia]CAA6671507.1 unnamed protein product [Spirodela intermedia]